MMLVAAAFGFAAAWNFLIAIAMTVRFDAAGDQIASRWAIASTSGSGVLLAAAAAMMIVAPPICSGAP